MTRDELKAIEALMREDITREMAENGISTANFRMAAGKTKTAKRKLLIGEFIQMRTSHYYNLTRWAKFGVTYEMLRAAHAKNLVVMTADRHRNPFAAKVVGS